MSSFDFKIQYPSIPLPRVSDDMGIAPVNDAIISQSGSIGIGSFDISPPSSPPLSDSFLPPRRLTGTVTSSEPTEAEYKSAIESVYSTNNTKPVDGDLITLNTSTEFNTRLFVYSTDDSAPDVATIQFEVNNKDWYAYNFIGGAGGSGLPGIQIIWEDLSESYIYVADLFASYDPANPSDWSMKIPVVDGSFNKLGITYDSGTNLYEDDAGTPPLQTLYRLRLIELTTDSNNNSLGLPLSVYGQYREVTLCVNGYPRQTLIKTA